MAITTETKKTDGKKPSINWTPEFVNLSELEFLKENPRTISTKSLEKLKNRIIRRGMHDVLKKDLDDKTVLSGNQRKKVLEELGVEKVWVMTPDRKLTEEERKAIVLESNTNDGEFDVDMLTQEYSDVLEEVGAGMESYMLQMQEDINSGTEVDVDQIEDELNCECPKCGFRFKA